MHQSLPFHIGSVPKDRILRSLASIRATSGRWNRHDKQDEVRVSWSLNIGKVAGTVLRLHITFVLFLTKLTNKLESGNAPAPWLSRQLTKA